MATAPATHTATATATAIAVATAIANSRIEAIILEESVCCSTHVSPLSARAKYELVEYTMAEINSIKNINSERVHENVLEDCKKNVVAKWKKFVGEPPSQLMKEAIGQMVVQTYFLMNK